MAEGGGSIAEGKEEALEERYWREGTAAEGGEGRYSGLDFFHFFFFH